MSAEKGLVLLTYSAPKFSMTNKDAALSFLKLVTDGKIREAYERHASPELRHHNPYHQGDARALMNGMEEADKAFPSKRFDVQHALEDGDFVAVHSHLILKPAELELAVVHLFRFQSKKIVEFWDVAQQIPKESPNQNGMF